ncbi:hypothetical protein ACQV9O_25940 [Ralstonia pseudosolanacearum]|uniref:hypothetical protein n=1 Tax=Ralstonia pseudosolanacearum TaxID=1310165 RepID=UPI003D28AB2E
MDERALNAYCAMVAVIANSVYSSMLSDAHQERNPLSTYSEARARAAYPYEQLVFYDMATSDFQWLADVLQPLKILTHATDPDGAIIPYAHRFLCHPSEAGRLARAHWRSGVPLDELLDEFLRYYSHYGVAYHGLEFLMNVVFHPRHGMEHVVQALAQLRYAERYQGGYRWTKKMRPYVRAYVATCSRLAIHRAYTLARYTMGDADIYRRPYSASDDD